MSAIVNATHRFPLWGPYSKKYMGVSHLPDMTRPGVRFDFTTVPAIANLDIHLPNVTLPTGWHPWDCAPDYQQWTYRVDLEWKDVVYADVSYTRLSDHAVLVRTELNNHSDLNQNLMINHFSSIEYPQPVYTDAVLPEGAVFLDAVDYASFTYRRPRPWDRQNADGFKKGEFSDPGFTNSLGLGDRAGKWQLPSLPFGTFGSDAGDQVSYTFTLSRPMNDAAVWIRYRSAKIEYTGSEMESSVRFVPADEDAVFLLNGTRVVFPVSQDLAFLQVPLGDLPAGEQALTFISEGKGGLELDFLAIVPTSETVSVRESSPDWVPEITEEDLLDGALVSLSYPGLQETYYLRTFNARTRFRRIETGSLEDAMSSRLSNPDVTFDDVLDPFTRSFRRRHSDDGFFHNTLVYTLFLAPGQTHVEYAVISDQPVEYASTADYEAVYQAFRPSPQGFNPCGRHLAFSTRLLKAALLTNIVFPIFKDDTYILHHTPGKRWDSLYTWDSGFIGLGMLDHNPAFADYILETYTCEPGKEAYAFLHHGSPVPVQFYLFYEMLQRTADKETLLKKYYSRLRYYYEFLIGRGSGSTTAHFASGLTTTYDYFYSSSGMDDYPPQSAMIHEGLQRHLAPAISSSQAIRSARILLAAAKALELTEDETRYEADIARLTEALQTWSWDPEASYYSYVLHDDNGLPLGIYRTSEGENLDKGLDGIYPLIAGICSPAQEEQLLKHLSDPKEMLCPYGISAVDQSASYFKVDGYWNGNVWFPHQWFIWKTMLDLGQTDFAFTIASLALNVWQKEVDATHYTFEMVSVVTGRGGWFHNFGGLSSPIGLWANAYYQPGTLNVGFDTWLDTVSWSDDFTRLSVSFTCSKRHQKTALLAVMAEGKPYEVLLDGQVVPSQERVPGAIEVLAGGDTGIRHQLIIRPVTV